MSFSSTYTETEAVVFSDRALAACEAETLAHGENETGGLLLGHRCGPLWFVTEIVDPGPESIHEVAFFSYDEAYVNHLTNKLRWFYDRPLDLLGLWHRHPGSMNVFSGTDRVTNARFLRTKPEGVLSAIVNIDPTFRITVYRISKGGERAIPAVRGSRLIPPPLGAYRGKAKTWEGAEALLRQAFQAETAAAGPAGVALPLEALLEATERDTEFLASLGASLALAEGGDGRLELRGSAGGERRTVASFGGAEGRLDVRLANKLYGYTPGLFARRIAELYAEIAAAQKLDRRGTEAAAW